MSATARAARSSVAGDELAERLNLVKLDPCLQDEQLLEVARDGRQPAIDLVAQVGAILQSKISDGAAPTKIRLRIFWAHAVVMRDLGATDVLSSELIRIALETGLLKDLGDRRGAATLGHVILWAMLGRNPFEDG